METIILILSVGILMILAFLIGAKVGQKVVNKEPITLPTINPVKIIQDHKVKQEISKEQEKTNTILDNINNYNGDGIGQKEIK